MKCEICKSESEYLESHHIVPKSRGGSNNESNLINLCIKCHGKAHDVSFSNKGGGLIKEGIQRKRKEHKLAQCWLDDNVKLYEDKMNSLHHKNEEEFQFIMGMIERGMMTAEHIKKYVIGDRVVIKTSITLNN